jgi:hypothetical protein
MPEITENYDDNGINGSRLLTSESSRDPLMQLSVSKLGGRRPRENLVQFHSIQAFPQILFSILVHA